LLPSIPGQPKLQLEFMSSQQLSNGINAMTALERGGQAKSVTTRISQLSTKENGAKLILLLPEFITHLVLFSLNEQSFLRLLFALYNEHIVSRKCMHGEYE